MGKGNSRKTPRVSYLVVSHHFEGHLRPALGAAAGLQRRIERQRKQRSGSSSSPVVRFAAISSARERVEAAGMEFVDLGEIPPGVRRRIDTAMATAVNAAMAPRRAAAECAATSYIPFVPTLVATNHSAAAMNEVFTVLEAFMLPRLLAALAPGGVAEDTNVVVAEFTTLAAQDAAELLGLPMAVLWHAPLGLCLMNAGLNHLNLASGLPIEIAPGVLMQPERMGPLQRAWNGFVKRGFHVAQLVLLGSVRNHVRAAYCLPPITGSGMFQIPEGIPHVTHIIHCLREMESDLRVAPKDWHFVGPPIDISSEVEPFPPPLTDDTIRAFLEDAQGGDEPVAYVATGTIVDATEREVLALAEGMRLAKGVRYVWSLKESCHHIVAKEEGAKQARGQPLMLYGGRVMVVSWAPQMAILTHPAVKLFVTHGGLNSTYEGLIAGKPMLVTPYFADQPANAQHITNKGFGAQLDPATLTGKQLAHTMQQLLADKAVTQRVQALSKVLQSRSGPEETAVQLERFASKVVAA